jgi:hypothetical protein
LFKHPGECCFPIKHIDAIACIVVEVEKVWLIIEVGADEGVAALDIVSEVREDALAFSDEVSLELLLGFAFEDFEKKGKLGDFDGLGVDIDTMDVVEKNTFALGGGKFPLTAFGLIDLRSVTA